MRGFDETLRDHSDYILRITEGIWDGREMPVGLTVGNLATPAELPNRQSLDEDEIGCEDDRAVRAEHPGAPAPVMSMTLPEWVLWDLRREFTFFDEPAIWKQIPIHAGHGA